MFKPLPAMRLSASWRRSCHRNPTTPAFARSAFYRFHSVPLDTVSRGRFRHPALDPAHDDGSGSY